MIFLTRQQHLQRKRIGRHNVHNGLLKPKNSEVRVFYATKTTFVYLRHRQHQQQNNNSANKTAHNRWESCGQYFLQESKVIQK